MKAVYHISIHEDTVYCAVSLPICLKLNEDEAKKLEDKIHDAMEEVLKEYFNESR